MTAYRGSAPACPTCHEALTPFQIDELSALVDLCGRCGGVWIDWEDGDFTELAREVPPAPVREMPRSGPASCPRCHRPLVVEVFQDTAEVLRCGECSGAFLPYASIGKIAAGTPAEVRNAEDRPAPEDSPPPSEQGSSPTDTGVWARVVRALRGAR